VNSKALGPGEKVKKTTRQSDKMIQKKTLRPSERVVSGEVTPGLITCINVKEMSQDGGLQKE
jgi:hypothetical protein